MDAQQLIDRLEEHAAEVPVGPAPLALMRTRARRRRQGRAAVVAAAAAVAVFGVGAAWQGGWGPGSDSTTVASEGAADPDAPPDGYRYVGVGDVVAAVPAAWSTNETECGTPTADTVIIDPGMTCMAAVPRSADVDSLTIQSSFGVGDTSGWTEIEIAGQPALLSPLSTERLWGDSAPRSPLDRQDVLVRQTVLVPSAETLFVAESSSADGEEVVGSLLDSITLLSDHTTVPGFQDLAFQRSGHRMADDYVDRLARLGLDAEVVTRGGGGLESGTVLETTPAVGSVVAPGDTVRVVAAR